MHAESDDALRQLVDLGNGLGGVLMPPAVDQLLGLITAVAAEIFGAAACSIAVVDEANDEIAFRAASGQGADRIVGVRMPAGAGIVGWALSAGQTIAVENVSSDSRFAHDVAAETGYVPTSIMAVPVEGREGPLAIIEILDRAQQGMANESEVLALLARQVAVVVEAESAFKAVGSFVLAAAAERLSPGARATLSSAAAQANPPDAMSAELGQLLRRLGDAGEAERAFAIRLLRNVLEFVAQRDRRV